MRLLGPMLAVALSLVCTSVHAQLDSARTAMLDRNVETYVKAIEGESIAIKIGEMDFMLGSCDEGEIRNRVAVKAYDHYLNSPIMGDESVAVHLTDNWFVPGKASFTNDIDLMNARIYAEFNRRSLIGCHAPSLRLRTPEDEVKEALGVVSDSLAGGSRRIRVLYLYDTDCSKCQVETIMLRAMFRQVDYPIDFMAVYTGSNAQAWEKYRSEQLDFTTEEARIFHYWDPEVDSDFQRKYGVLQTPRMLLIGKDGTVLGRNLDTQALMSLLEVYSDKPLDYGEGESKALFEALLPSDDRTVTADSIASLSAYIARKTLVETKDTVNFRQLTGDLLYYLSGKRGEAFRYGADRVSRTMVLDRPDVWTSRDDSLKVVGLAEMISDMVAKAPVGARVPAVRAHGTMISGRGDNSKVWDLSRLRKGTFVLFHTRGCEVCKAEIAAARELVAGSRAKVLLIDMDEVYERADSEMESLMDAFDLSALPFMLEVGRRGVVTRKYTTLVDK